MEPTSMFIIGAVLLGAAEIIFLVCVAVIRFFGKEAEAEFNGYGSLNPDEGSQLPRFSFKDENGGYSVIKYRMACPFIRYKQGQKLKVYYLPKNTDMVIIWDSSLIFLGLGTALGCAVMTAAANILK